MNTPKRTRFRDAGILAWMVVILPLASVVAGIATLVIALRAGSSDAVIDPVQRTAQIQERDLEADRRTASFGLGAQLTREDTGISVRVTGALPPATALTLTLAHPLAGSQDQHIPLARTGDRQYQSTTAIDNAHDWNVQLAPADGSWRLVGRLVKDQDALALRPALRP